MISVIIPVYNVEKFLPQCLDSVLSQTYKNIEIIIIDDGTKDISGQICDEYAQKDSRIKVIHQENEGLSNARNKGLQIAKGEWTFFIDSDDWIHTETLKQLYDFAIVNNCDLVQCNHYYVYENYCLYRLANKKEKNNNILDCKEAMHQLIINDRIKNFAWGKLYKTDLIRDLKFPEGKYFEDSFWQHLVFHRAPKIGIINTPLYFYRQRKDSISGHHSSKINDLLEGYSKRLDFISSHYPEFASLMNMKYKDLYKSINGNSGNKRIIFKDIVNVIIKRVSVIGKYKKVKN